MRNIRVLVVLALWMMFGSAFPINASAAVDVDAAKNLARRNHCFKCHSIDKKEKDGPTYKEVAEKYRGKADAEDTLVEHLSSGKKVKLKDGHEEEHRIVKVGEGEIRNLVAWILSL